MLCAKATFIQMPMCHMPGISGFCWWVGWREGLFSLGQHDSSEVSEVMGVAPNHPNIGHVSIETTMVLGILMTWERLKRRIQLLAIAMFHFSWFQILKNGSQIDRWRGQGGLWQFAERDRKSAANCQAAGEVSRVSQRCGQEMARERLWVGYRSTYMILYVQVSSWSLRIIDLVSEQHLLSLLFLVLWCF